MSEWKCYKLNDISSLSNGINFDKSAYTSGVKLIGVSDFKNRIHPDYDSLQEVDSKVVKSGDYLEKGDIVFVRSNGNKELVGRCMMIDRDVPVTFSGFCIKLHLKDKKRFEPVFFNYLFIQNLSQSRLGNCEVNVPDIETQKRIATILSRYDSLIENYQKQIKLLEEAAQRLYKEWFVDLHFPGHENTKIVDGVPEGWEKKTLDEYCSVFTGKKNANAAVPLGKYKFFTCGETPLQIDSFIYDGPAIIISGNGSYTGRTTFYEGKFDLYQRTYACTINNNDNKNMIYGLFEIVKCELTAQISGGTHGAAIPYIVMGDVTKFTFTSNDIVLRMFSKIIKSFLDRTICISSQIRLLTEARDRLLPKLMSGDIKIESLK